MFTMTSTAAMLGLPPVEPDHAAKMDARKTVADMLDNALDPNDVQIDNNSPVELVDGGAWVSCRIWAPVDHAPKTRQEKAQEYMDHYFGEAQ